MIKFSKFKAGQTLRWRSMNTVILYCFVFVVCLFSTRLYSGNTPLKAADAEKVRIAVASNFYHSLLTLLDDFRREETQRLENAFIISSGATGALFSQILHGAQFDIFLAADKERPEQLEKMQLTSFRGSYAFGKLALWSTEAKFEQITFLKEYDGRLAIANEKIAPFGKAAIESLQYLNLHDAFSKRLLRGSNINQAFQFVDTGNVHVALVAESQLLQAHNKFNHDKYLNYGWVPESYYLAIDQQLVVLKQKRMEKKQRLITDFVEFILSEPSQKKLTDMGYKSIYERTATASVEK